MGKEMLGCEIQMLWQADTAIKRNESCEDELMQGALSLEHGRDAQLHSLTAQHCTAAFAEMPKTYSSATLGLVPSSLTKNG
jgi:hypothetical protein